MATFKVYPDGNNDAAMDVEAPTARRAAEAYWEERVIDGEAQANMEERLIVEHDDGPNVDPSATWFIHKGRVFAKFDVTVTHVEVSAVAVEAK
jgi:hypothetical protein